MRQSLKYHSEEKKFCYAIIKNNVVRLMQNAKKLYFSICKAAKY